MHRCYAVVLSVVVLFPGVAAAQSGVQLEGYAGPAYVQDSGEGSSGVALTLGGVVWLSSTVGVGANMTVDVRENHRPSTVAGDRTFLAPANARQSAVVVQFRTVEQGTEVGFGVGLSHLSYDDRTIVTGIRRADGSIDPTSPRVLLERTGTEAIRMQLLIGRPVTRHVKVAGGFTYDVAGDIHPFVPMFVVSAH
jgi:hypothetical protein